MKRWFLTAVCSSLLLSGCSSLADNKAPHDAVEVTSTSDQKFESDVLKASQPVLVDFYATWCPPCKRMAPVVDDVANQFAGKAKVFKVDVDENPQVSQALGITSIPTFVVFKDGKVLTANTGFMPKDALVTMVESAFSPNITGSKKSSNL
ncbi:MAG TPA: thioredoxin [Drouetiella sp.]|jgi:thioredoxin 1